MARMPLKEVDSVEVTTLVDNSIDILMAGSETARRFPLTPDVLRRPIHRSQCCSTPA